FQIKHLLWLVFATALLAGLCRVVPGLAVFLMLSVFVFFIGMTSVTTGVWVMQKLQDQWTGGDADRADQPRIVGFIITATWVLCGMSAMIAVLVFSCFGVVALLVFLNKITVM